VILLLKLTLVPVFVACIAVVGRHWGAKVAGLLSGFPVIAGPIVYFIYLDQGAKFAQAAAASTVVGVVPLSSFCFVYAWSASRLSWCWALAASLLVYGVLAVWLVKLALSLLAAAALALLVLLLQIFLSPKHGHLTGLTSASNSEVVIRMFCAACLVLLVTCSAKTLGAGYSGVLAAFPIASTVIAVFSHKNHSAFHAMDSLRALKFGLLSLLMFFFILALLANYLDFTLAFLAAIPAAFAIQLFIRLIKGLLIGKRI